MWGLFLMLGMMLVISPVLVTLALRQTKQDIDKKDDKGH